MSALQTGRNPFARRTVRKRRVWAPASGCTWCGSYPIARKGKPALWQYYIDADSARESGDIKGTFCSIDCLNAYHS